MYKSKEPKIDENVYGEVFPFTPLILKTGIHFQNVKVA